MGEDEVGLRGKAPPSARWKLWSVTGSLISFTKQELNFFPQELWMLPCVTLNCQFTIQVLNCQNCSQSPNCLKISWIVFVAVIVKIIEKFQNYPKLPKVSKNYQQCKNCQHFQKQARKARRCDSYLQIWKKNQWLTHWPTGRGRC